MSVTTKTISMRRRQILVGGGAVVEVLGASAAASALTDGDGRFFVTASATRGQRYFEYRIARDARRGPIRRVHFARKAPAGHAHIAQVARDASGVWRSTFAATLA